jgi:hypothetical protein
MLSTATQNCDYFERFVYIAKPQINADLADLRLSAAYILTYTIHAIHSSQGGWSKCRQFVSVV